MRALPNKPMVPTAVASPATTPSRPLRRRGGQPSGKIEATVQVREPEFDVSITLTDLAAIRVAIQRWGEHPTLVDAYVGATLHDHFSQWAQFVDTDWSNWDPSEYNHEIGCRVWIQLSIEHASAETAARLRAAVTPIDERFKSRMRPAQRTIKPTPVLREHPYFWETHTLHPDLVVDSPEPDVAG